MTLTPDAWLSSRDGGHDDACVLLAFGIGACCALLHGQSIRVYPTALFLSTSAPLLCGFFLSISASLGLCYLGKEEGRKDTPSSLLLQQLFHLHPSTSKLLKRVILKSHQYTLSQSPPLVVVLPY